MAEFKVINTQEEFDERIKERIERAEKKAADAFKGWLSPEEVETLKKAHKGEIEKINAAHAEALKKYEGYDEKFTEQANKIKALEVQALKTKIATEKKLPLDAVEFLQGEDEETITANAEKFLKLSGSHSQGFTRNTETPQGDAKEQQWREVSRSLQKN